VTWAEWQAVRTYAIANGYDLTGVGTGLGASFPVENVNWYDIVKWCNAKSQMDGKTPVYTVSNGVAYKSGVLQPAVSTSANGYRLPTEAEWEWAARGGTKSLGYTYSGSNTLNLVGWYAYNSKNSAKAVGTKAANELGLYDMSGNVWEFCSNTTYRGGSYFSGEILCTISSGSLPYNWPRQSGIAFRLACNP
jgi:formylglycine-generating enzyme required for sulfatase activity